MDRLLSPNEAKFWLMDWRAPMNTVIVTRTSGRVEPDALVGTGFTVPMVALDRHQRPRWAITDAAGEVEEIAGGDWLAVAERLLDRRVGTEGHPPWHAAVMQQDDASTVVLAVNHAVADYRTGQWLADHLLAGTWPGDMAPACEEVLPAKLYGGEESLDLVDEWWLSRASARWEAIGLDRLAAVLPPPGCSRLDVVRLSEDDTAALQARMDDEGVSLNGAVAVALRDLIGAGRVAHAVDMSRFVRPPLPDGPGVAVSHVFADSPAGEFWEAARGVRGAIFERIQSGEAGDALLILPRALLREGGAFVSEPSAVTVSGFPTYRRPEDIGAGHPMQIVLSSARGGGDVVMLTYDEGRLQLIGCSPEGREGIDLGALAGRLLANI